MGPPRGAFRASSSARGKPSKIWRSSTQRSSSAPFLRENLWQHHNPPALRSCHGLHYGRGSPVAGLPDNEKLSSSVHRFLSSRRFSSRLDARNEHGPYSAMILNSKSVQAGSGGSL